MTQKTRTLFVLHTTARTGAPIALLEMIKFQHKDVQDLFDVIILDKGELIPEFRQVSRIFSWYQFYRFWCILQSLHFNKLNHWLAAAAIKIFLSNRYQSICANTVGAIPFTLEINKSLKTHAVLYIHESEYAVDRFIGREKFRELVHKFKRIIAVSETVKQNLVDNYSIDEKNISIINPIFFQAKVKQDKHKSIIEPLGITENTFLVGGSGSIDWIKGPDIFLLVAATFHKIIGNGDYHFVWIGSSNNTQSLRDLQHDQAHLGLSKVVTFVGKTTTPLAYYSKLDVFVLTSREESFSLVISENISIGTPIIGFQNVSGIEQVLHKCESCVFVPYLDIEAMANELAVLYRNPNMRTERRSAILNFSKSFIADNQSKLAEFPRYLKCSP